MMAHVDTASFQRRVSEPVSLRLFTKQLPNPSWSFAGAGFNDRTATIAKAADIVVLIRNLNLFCAFTICSSKPASPWLFLGRGSRRDAGRRGAHLSRSRSEALFNAS